MPQPIGLFLFCIEFAWGWTKLISVLCMNLLVAVEIKLHTEFGRVWLKNFFIELVQNQILKIVVVVFIRKKGLPNFGLC